MSTEGTTVERSLLGYGLLVLGGSAVVAALVLVQRSAGPVTAIKGSYLLIGTVLGAMLYTLQGRGWVRRPDWSNRTPTYLVVAVAAIGLAATVLAGARLFVLLVVIPLGYAFVLAQYLTGGSPKRIVWQSTVLFALDPVTKVATTGFYFGNGDTLRHVGAVDALVGTGTIDAVGELYSLYDAFPGMHVAAGSVGLVTGLGPYESVVALNVLLYASAIPLLYSFGRLFFTERTAVGVSLALALLAPIHYFAGYAFPQSFATVLFVGLLYVAYSARAADAQTQRRFALLAIPIGASIVFSHHLTVLLFTPIVLLLLAVGRIAPLLGDVHRSGIPRVIPIGIVLLGAIGYWTHRTEGFILLFYEFTETTLSGRSLFVSDTGGLRTLFAFGREVAPQTVAEATLSLAAADGVYFTLFGALVVFSGLVVVDDRREHPSAVPLLFVGVLGTLIVLETPLVALVNRLRLPIAFLVAFPLGVAVARAALPDRVGIGEVLLAVVVLGAAVTAPLAAGDDLYGVHAGPNLYEVYTTPEPQRTFSAQELAELEATAEHIQSRRIESSSLWITREALGRFGVREVGIPGVGDEGIRSSRPIVYRTRWTDHQVGTGGATVSNLVVSEGWLRRAIDRENKVYSTGGVGIVQDRGTVRLNGST